MTGKSVLVSCSKCKGFQHFSVETNMISLINNGLKCNCGGILTYKEVE